MEVLLALLEAFLEALLHSSLCILLIFRVGVVALLISTFVARPC